MNDSNHVTPEMIAAAEMLMAAQAYERLIEPVVTGYRRRILQRLQLHTAEVFRESGIDHVVLDDKDAYFLTDADLALYEQECIKARDEAKLLVEDPSQCPLLVATHVRVNAENDLLDAMAAHGRFGRTFRAAKDDFLARPQALDVALRMLAVHVRDAQSILNDLIKKGMK